MSALLRTISYTARSHSRHARAFHSPYAVLGSSPLTTPPTAASNVSSVYEKQTDYSPEPSIPHSGRRTYVVSEPDASATHYQVPSGAYPTTAPYVNFTATEAPNTQGGQTSSTSSDLLAHEVTTGAAEQHPGGVGESAAVRNASAPGEMGARGGGFGGEEMMDKAGTVAGKGTLGAAKSTT